MRFRNAGARTMMFGHLGIAGAVRSVSRSRMSSVALLALFAASIAPDLLDGVYFVIGLCNPSGLFSHTVYVLLLQAAVIGGIAFLATESLSVGIVFAVTVLLHVPADFITGRKLLLPGGEIAGLEVYARPLLDLAVEVPFVILGWWLLRRGGQSPRWATSAWALVLVLALQATDDVVDQITGPSPHSVCVDGKPFRGQLWFQ